MAIFKYIIASLIAWGGAEEEWSIVPKPVKPQEQGEERDSSIWPLFAKSLGEEQFMVRFPDIPQYRIMEDGRLEISGTKEGEYFVLTVSRLNGGGEESGAPRFIEGKWVHETTLHSERYQYQFRTISEFENSPNHKDFVNSFRFFS